LAGIDWLDWMPEPDWSYSTHWLSVCLIHPARVSSSGLIAALSAELIEARPVWKPMHLQPVFQNCRYYQHDNSSVSDGLFEQGVCLPSGSNMSEAQLQRIIEAIRAI
jgi:dTDP-4-amino-4,6-dideoxygalactose transaminase